MDDESTIAAYRRNGFAVIPGLFSAEELEEIARQLEAHLRLDLASAPRSDVIFEADSERSLRCLFRIHERSAYFDRLMRDARLMQLVQRLFNGADVIADGTMLIDKAPWTTYEFPWHQDNAYQFWNPPDAVAVTLALDDSTAESGAIVCLAGSHRESILPHQPSGVFGASRGLVSDPSTDEYSPVTLSLKPGDVSLHHVNTIHRTGPNRTSKHRRNLGFAYHSSRSVCDHTAADQYKRDLEKFLQTQQVPA
ncbi:MAG: phytanoyl-CoA dioxygenase family protein [Planctomycetaceae bacterium]|nr:phytanoyl-CoA dioxygenase family protein [Planctomycetaceae bacterium]